jgi:enoyl-CoA hydratase
MALVLYEVADRIASVTLARPERKNAISRAMNDELWDVWRRFAADDTADIAILTGQGDAFCAGADLGDYIPKFLDRTMLEVRENASTGLGGITRGLHRIYKPIIAAVNGWALAGGFELALACDIRVASTAARFGSYEVKRGFHHGDGGIVRLVAILGLGRAMELVLTGRDVEAGEALMMGLVSAVVPPERLAETARGVATTILRNGQKAVRSAKETILDVVGRDLDTALKLEAIYGYSSADPSEVRARLEQFFAKTPSGGKP